nr:hypothetical protein CFP56_16763 [Quercus suber]
MIFPAVSAGLLSGLVLVALQAGITDAAIPTDSSYTAAQIANGFAFQNITNITALNQQYIVNSRHSSTCTYANAKVRKEWYDDEDLQRRFIG